MAKKKNVNDNYFDSWSKVISEMKTKVKRYYRKTDINRETPYIFDGLRTDFMTGENLVLFHTKRIYDEQSGEYPCYVLSYELFIEMFDEIEVEI